jgi:hypothetical protein
MEDLAEGLFESVGDGRDDPMVSFLARRDGLDEPDWRHDGISQVCSSSLS